MLKALQNAARILIGGWAKAVGYDARKLMAPGKLDADRALELYGLALKRILRLDEVSKEEVEEAFREALRSAGVEKLFHGSLIALLYNDLRRLGVLTVGHGGAWSAGEKARLTNLGVWLSRCVDVDARVLGALAVASCYLRPWDADPQEAGFCRGVYGGPLDEYAGFVRRAVGIFYDEAPAWCIPYGSDIIKAKALLTSSSGSPSGLTTT